MNMRKQWISAILMAIIGGGIYTVSASYKPQPTAAVIRETESMVEIPTLSSRNPGTEEPPSTAAKEEETIFQPDLEELNLTHFFPEGSDPGDISQSYAQKVFQELVIEDEEWMNGIYTYADLTPEQFAAHTGQPRSRVMGSYNPKETQHDPDNPDTWTIRSFRNIRTNVTNGDGSPISAYSNVIEIMSVANVYTFYKDAGNYDLFLSYARSLWERSHSYSIGMSDIYYCEGCLSEEEERERLEREAAAEEEATKAALTDNDTLREEATEGEQEITIVESGAPVITATRRTQISGEDDIAEADNGESQNIAPVLEAGQKQGELQNHSQETETADNTDPSQSEKADPGSDSSAEAGSQSADPGLSEQQERTVTSAPESDPASTETAGLPEASPVISGADGSTDETEIAGKASPADVTLPSDNPGISQTQEQVPDTDDAASGQERCPGHIDLLVQMKIRGLKEKNGLFKADRVGNAKENYEENGWLGWTPESMESARSLAGQDWYQRYGITVSSISMRNPLTSSEIEEYMNRLPEGLSQTRKDIIRFALFSVGKVPYYWGGKPSSPNYSRNGFGALVSPDEKGRILRGLDCSGWINWVYWSVTGNRLPHESTSGLALCGSPVSRECLQPGDIIIRTGEDAHVIMFLEWTEDGSIRCIHESSANINNVTVGVRDANWPYYRKLID